jgi:hypothetical protein
MARAVRFQYSPGNNYTIAAEFWNDERSLQCQRLTSSAPDLNHTQK